METLYARLTPQQHQDPKVIASKFNWYYHLIGDAQAYVDLCNQQGTDTNFNDDDSTLQYAEALMVLGQRDRAVSLVRPLLDKLKTRLAADPESANLLNSLAYTQALLGDHDATMATIARILALLKPGDPVRKQVYLQANAAIIYGWIGEKEKAVDLVEPLLKVPTAAFSSVLSLRYDIDFSPMRGYPRWEALLADPANNQSFTY